MIADKLLAEKISRLMLDIGGQLNESLHSAQTEASVEDFIAYRTMVGRIMGLILTDLLNPLYSRHPSLKPPELE